MKVQKVKTENQRDAIEMIIGRLVSKVVGYTRPTKVLYGDRKIRMLDEATESLEQLLEQARREERQILADFLIELSDNDRISNTATKEIIKTFGKVCKDNEDVDGLEALKQSLVSKPQIY